MKTLKFLAIPILFSLFFILISAANANRETQRIHNSVNVLKEFDKMKDKIPHELLEQYEGIIIMPRLVNFGFGFGAKRGRGVAMVKLANGKWSDPVFVTLTGGSFGFQLGVESVDLVLVFKHKGVLAKVKNGDFTIGGDISAAAGPVGRSTTASTDYKLEAEVYSYSRSRGLFAGISVNGTNLSIDKTSDFAYYGPEMDSHDIFESSKNETGAVKQLRETVSSL
jgi:lipid-binding SYLF domain-containing protein